MHSGDFCRRSILALVGTYPPPQNLSNLADFHRLAARAQDPGSRIGVLEMSPAASNAANSDLPIGLSHRPRDGSVVSSPIA